MDTLTWTAARGAVAPTQERQKCSSDLPPEGRPGCSRCAYHVTAGAGWSALYCSLGGTKDIRDVVCVCVCVQGPSSVPVGQHSVFP
jgi:hypothetical protein